MPPLINTVQCFDFEMDTGDPSLTTASPQIGAPVQCQLLYNLVTSVSPAANLQPQLMQTTTDANGRWQFNLVPNTNINPANTTYLITTPSKRYEISVPSSGPVQSSTIMVSVPVALSPTTSTTGPLTVSGAFTVNTGPVSLPAGSVGVAALTGVLPIVNGGTGSGTKNFVDLTTVQTAAGNKTFSGATTLSGGATISGGATVNGGATLNGAIKAPTSLVVGGSTLTGGFTADVQGNLRNTTAYKARAFASGSVTINNGVITKIPLNTKSYDPNTNFSTVNNNYTVPVAGFYLITGRFAFIDNANTTQDMLALIYKNGAELFRGSTSKTTAAVSSSSYGSNVFDVQQLAANDVIDLRGFLTSANGCGIETGTTNAYMAIHYLSS